MSKTGCDVVGSYGGIEKFKRVLEAEGRELCDDCPYMNCIASQTQAISMKTYEEKYARSHMPDCDRRTVEFQKRSMEIERKKEAYEAKKRTNRRVGRPRRKMRGFTAAEE